MTEDKTNQLERLGKNIAKRRYAKNLSQDALAAEAGISNRTLQKLELAQTDPQFSTLEKLAEVLGVEVKDLLD